MKSAKTTQEIIADAKKAEDFESARNAKVVKEATTGGYSLKCKYYTKVFKTLNELVQDVQTSGMDPNYFITRDGKSIGEKASDLIQF